MTPLIFINVIFIFNTVFVKSEKDSLDDLWKYLQTKAHDVKEKREPRNIPLTPLLDSLNPDYSDVTLNDNNVVNKHRQQIQQLQPLQERKDVNDKIFERNILMKQNSLRSNVAMLPHTFSVTQKFNRYWHENKYLPPIRRTNELIKKPVNRFGSTKHLREIFIGRCFEYQFQKKITPPKEYDCVNLWKLFIKAFIYKPPCDVTLQDYKPFLNRVREEIPINKGLLWSGTRELAHKYSDFYFTKRFTTLEDTMAGYLVNGLTWCGKQTDPGINFEQCPWKCSIQEPFWAMANKQFAQNLRGEIHIILNGTRQHLDDRRIYPSYMKNRYYLGPYILPELTAERITKIKIVVVHTLHLKPLESCGEKTVQVLLEEIERKGIPVECYNDLDEFKDIICVDDPKSLECANLQRRDSITYNNQGSFEYT